MLAAPTGSGAAGETLTITARASAALSADAGCTGWSQPGNRGSSCALALDTDLSYAPPTPGRVLRTTSPALAAGTMKLALSARLTGVGGA